jgi:dipeptidyl aminopeptidase/acylaminoacyl peptidase
LKRFNLFFVTLFLCFICIGCSRSKEYEYTIEDINVITDSFSMPGKLTIPTTSKKVPAVVFVHGSGPGDMDETMGALKPFKELSEKLAILGIASIRYNKRTLTYSDTLKNEYGLTVYDETINDALSAVNLLKNDPRIAADNVFIIGHSFGACFAPVILNLDNDINGAIMLAGTTEHLLDVLLEQVKTVDEIQKTNTYDQYLPYVNIAKTMTKVKAGEESHNYFGAYPAYWVSYNAIDLDKETIESTNNHNLLIMQGGLDVQVTVKHFENYKKVLEGKDNVTYKLYDQLNHGFVDGTNESLESAYQVPKDIPNEVIDDIYNWIKNNKK